ncbi:MAG: glycosyltransferase [bacterium]
MNRIIPQIDVCIATYQRPHLLGKLLASLLCQETEGKFTYAVIVSDNDPNGGAEPVVKEYVDKGVEIIYDIEPQQNISRNRNRALSHASGDFIAIIDDDQFVGSHWLLSLYSTMTSYKADVVFGAVTPVFENHTSALVRKSNAYGIPNFPEGYSEDIIPHAGNSLFRAGLIVNMNNPFDITLGNKMGEDSKFFESLRKRGGKMAWSRQALCHEYIPPHRAKLSWLLKRYYHIGFALFQAYEEERGCQIIYLHKSFKTIHLFIKTAKQLLLFPFFAGLGLINANCIAKAVTCLKQIAMYIGLIFYLRNTKPDG